MCTRSCILISGDFHPSVINISRTTSPNLLSVTGCLNITNTTLVVDIPNVGNQVVILNASCIIGEFSSEQIHLPDPTCSSTPQLQKRPTSILVVLIPNSNTLDFKCGAASIGGILAAVVFVISTIIVIVVLVTKKKKLKQEMNKFKNTN